MNFRNWKLKTKIILGFIGILFLTLLLGGLSYKYITEITHKKIPLLTKVNQIDKLVSKLRKNEKDFFLRDLTNPDFFESGESEYMDKYDTNFQKLLSTTDFIKDNQYIRDNSGAVQHIEEIQSLAESYKKDFYKVVDKIEKRGFKGYGLIGEFRSSIHNLEDTLENLSVDAQQLKILMLQLRRAEKDYLLRLDMKYPAKFSGIVEEFKIQLTNTDVEEETKEELMSLVEDYQDKFNQIVNIDQEIGLTAEQGLKKQYRTTVHKLTPKVQKIEEEIKEIISAKITNIRIVIPVVVLLIILLGVGIALLVLRPLKRLVRTANLIAAGDLDHTVEIKSQDEIGQLSQAIQKMQGELKGMVSNIDDTAQMVKSSSQQLSAVSQENASASELIAEHIEKMTIGANDQNQYIKETRSQVDELFETIDMVNENYQKLYKSSGAVTEEANSGKEVIDQAVDQMEVIDENTANANKDMKELKSRLGEISQILDVISNLADQTNLLALNASIEAARAGERGKGFSVVAEEIRELAEQSQSSAEDISNLVRDIFDKTDKAVVSMEKTNQEVISGKKIISETGDTFDKILELIKETAIFIEQVSEEVIDIQSSGKQAKESIKKITEISNEFTGNMEEVSASTEEQSSSAEETSVTAEELTQLAEKLEEMIQKFKKEA